MRKVLILFLVLSTSSFAELQQTVKYCYGSSHKISRKLITEVKICPVNKPCFEETIPLSASNGCELNVIKTYPWPARVCILFAEGLDGARTYYSEEHGCVDENWGKTLISFTRGWDDEHIDLKKILRI